MSLGLVAPMVQAAGGGTVSAQVADGVTVERIEIMTTAGRIVAELYPDHAPRTVENFLAYVEDDAFTGGSFFRSVRLDNQPDDSVRIEVVQGGPSRAFPRERYREPLALERTRDTGLLHENGTLSMARAGPDTARAQFFICVGAQPSLDFGGARNPDGQGFAAFGRVTSGMDVVQRIQQGQTDGQRLVEPVEIETVRRLR
jgi:peptidyl-prolyl cis-trans isomerase A (cyclophilin A)